MQNTGDALCSLSQNALEAENPMGFAYIISHNGLLESSGSYGLARSVAEGNKPMSTNEIMHVASVSKTITTAAVLKLLDEKGISVHAKIEPYLPAQWTRGNGIEDITFLQLLTHEAGLNQVGAQTFGATSFSNLASYISSGASAPGTPSYSNTHHALFRVIIPILWGENAPSSGYYDDITTQAIYEQYIQQEIFHPIGVDYARLNTNLHDPLLAYPDNSDNSGKGDNSDFASVAGGFGWCLSTYELAKFWAYLWYSDEIIDDGMRQYLTNDFAGLWNTVANGTWGTYYCKLGAWDYGNDHSLKTLVMKFPDDTQVTVFVNSNISSSLRSIAQEAYDEAHGCF